MMTTNLRSLRKMQQEMFSFNKPILDCLRPLPKMVDKKDEKHYPR